MKLTARKSELNGSVQIPASKSHTIRALTIAALAQGRSVIRNPLVSSDALSAAKCYAMLGASINTDDPSQWQVTGTGGQIQCPDEIIDVGNSGTTLRIALGSAALADPGASCSFTGDHQIQSRPVGPLMEALTNLGAKCSSRNNNGKPPVVVQGGLQGGHTPLEAPTSQYLSSLLMCTPLAPTDTEIDVTLLNEPGYVQITLDWLDRQGIIYQNDQLRHFVVKGNQQYRPFDLPVPADFSSATFFLCAAALVGGNVTLQGLDFSDSQPDKAVVDYLRTMGADITIGDHGVTICGSELQGAELDMNQTPDALPAMAVTGALAQGTTKLVNVPQARNKETDRIRCMAEELGKLGAKVEELPDGLVIQHSTLKPARLDGRHDHRIVMALSLAALALNEPCSIHTAEAINVTFPNYVDLMTSLGADMDLARE
jgi:3-phosphoshikimate 1-carboxyvinyltransferase